MVATATELPTGIFRPSEIPQEWRDILLLIPGYDSIATAGDASFDAGAAQLALDFFPQCLRHVEGEVADQPFVLEPWQKSFIANLMGWKRRDEHGRKVRRYRESLLYVARKNGKTPTVSGLALLVFFTDEEKGQQDFIAAGEKEQAGALFRHCKGMVEAEPELESRCKIYGGNATAGQSKSIAREEDHSYLRVISADAPGKHGGNTHLAIIDELHVQPNRDLVDVFQTSFASSNRKQPLFICITTADYDRPSICNEKYEYACKVRDGIINDQTFLPVIYEVPRDVDWRDEQHWIKANPNLGVSVSLDYLRRECKRAQEIPAYENTFRRLNLNQKTSTAERLIQMHLWDAGKRNIDLSALKGRECYPSLDIGATSDFVALCRLFPHDDAVTVEIPSFDDVGKPIGSRRIVRRSFTALMTFWLPEEPVKRDHRMQAVIDGWRKEGFIRATPGSSVDYDMVLVDIEELLAPYTFRDFALDRGFQGGQMSTNLQKKYGDRKIFQFPQGILSMAAPFREFLELLSAERLHHAGDPVMRWMVSNVVAERRGNLVKPSKEKSPEKIDGVTAAVMSIGRALFWSATAPPPYKPGDLWN
jgi:phage terminase large subunit-like protein